MFGGSVVLAAGQFDGFWCGVIRRDPAIDVCLVVREHGNLVTGSLGQPFMTPLSGSIEGETLHFSFTPRVGVPVYHQCRMDTDLLRCVLSVPARTATFELRRHMIPSVSPLAPARFDERVLERIRQAAFSRSRVMEHAFFLTEMTGPRLTGSPAFRRAGEWAIDTLRGYGLDRVRKQKLDWGRGWHSEQSSLHILVPTPAPLTATPFAWSRRTEGIAEGDVTRLSIPRGSQEQPYTLFYEKWRGRLKSKIILADDVTTGPLPTSISRFSEDDLQLLSIQLPVAKPQNTSNANPPNPNSLEQTRILQSRLNRFLTDEGVIAILYRGRGDSGLISSRVISSVAPEIVWLRDGKYDAPPASFLLAAEHYDRLVRMLAQGGVRVEARLEAKFSEEPEAAFNVLADLLGSERPEEVVLIGGHLDSWNWATGATDNAAGVAVVMEAMRILRELKLPLRRTIRAALWGGHEGAGLGSRTYLSESKAEHERFSVYFNLDDGGGKIRGIYLQRNELARPIFQAWIHPLRGLGVTALSPNGVTGSDHVAFDLAGIPGFNFIQDSLDYERTHHSNADTYDHLIPADLQQSATVMAWFAYLAATEENLIPRKQR